jgi:hypothetical protein
VSILAVDEAIITCISILMMIIAHFLAVFKSKGKMPDISRYLVPLSLALYRKFGRKPTYFSSGMNTANLLQLVIYTFKYITVY